MILNVFEDILCRYKEFNTMFDVDFYRITDWHAKVNRELTHADESFGVFVSLVFVCTPNNNSLH